jgi:hypothetical protein
LNQFAELQYYQIYVVAAAICILQLVVSPLWLRHFYFGPPGVAVAQPDVLAPPADETLKRTLPR